MLNSISHKIPKLSSAVVLVSLLSLMSCTDASNLAAVDARSAVELSQNAVDINTATAVELERVPSVGPGLARKIVDHRERFGRFRRVEELMLIDGISDSRFRRMRHLLTVD